MRTYIILFIRPRAAPRLRPGGGSGGDAADARRNFNYRDKSPNPIAGSLRVNELRIVTAPSCVRAEKKMNRKITRARRRREKEGRERRVALAATPCTVVVVTRVLSFVSHFHAVSEQSSTPPDYILSYSNEKTVVSCFIR